MNNNSQRIEWIDLAKTFMIMVVIFCHVPQYDTIEKAFFYSFQMPFFFFVSGFLHKRVDILSERFHKYWKTLLIPYFIFQIIYYPYYLVQNVLQDGRDIHNILDWGIEPLIETIIGLPLNGPTWFIFSLFIMKAIIDLGHKEKNQFVYLLLFLCTSFIISYLFIMKDDSIKISFCIDGTAKYMPYFILGQIFKLKFSKQMRNTSNRYILLSLSILFTIATILALEMIRCETINSNYILYYCIAALGTSSVILFCKFINKCPDLIKIISSGTIVILGTHWMFIGFINFVVEKAFVIQAVKYSTLVATIVVLFITFVNYFIIKFCMKHFTIILGGRHTNKKKYDNLYIRYPMANNRHAYLIMAHNEWELLNTLLSLIDDPRNDIFLHIDKKVKTMPDLYQPKYSKLYFTPKRYDVRWGDVGQVHSEMHLFRTAYEHGPYQYYHKLSGVDLPIKTQDYIHDFFDKHNGKEFIGFFTLTDFIKGDIERKRRRYYFLMRWNYRTPFVPKWKVTLAKIVRHAALKIQDILHVDRGNELTFRTGHNWVSLTGDAVKYLLDQEDFINRRFANTTCGDEMYKHSILISNPEIRERIYDLEDGIHSCMRFIDFNRASAEQKRRGEPYTWQDGDAEELLKSEYLFARKFSSKYPGVIREIEKYINNN